MAPGPRVGVCDYGVGNLRSVERALENGGASVVVSADPERLGGCAGLVLPGVGAFATAATALARQGLDQALHVFAASGRPILGVCLGFQLLFSDSDEGDGGRGLGLIAGAVRRLPGGAAKVPHIGWNRLHLVRRSTLLAGLDEAEYAYFVHSYAVSPADPAVIVATTDHGGEVVAAVEAGNVAGTQFHPEKSSRAGLRVYANFVNRCAAPVGA